MCTFIYKFVFSFFSSSISLLRLVWFHPYPRPYNAPVAVNLNEICSATNRQTRTSTNTKKCMHTNWLKHIFADESTYCTCVPVFMNAYVWSMLVGRIGH